MIRIQSILNNNAVVAKMDDGTTAIVMGSGVGFSVKKGDIVPQNKIREIYHAQSVKNNALLGLIDTLDPLSLEISTLIVENSRRKTHQEYSPFLLIELADHISLAMERKKEGVLSVNLLTEEIKTLYPEEYSAAKQALEIVKGRTGIELDAEEAGLIAMHLISSRIQKHGTEQEDVSVALVNEIVALVQKYFGITVRKEEAQHVRFLTHLKFLAARILKGEAMDADKLREIYDSIGVIPNQDIFAVELKEHILRKYNYSLCDDEIFYIMIHLRAIL